MPLIDLHFEENPVNTSITKIGSLVRYGTNTLNLPQICGPV